MSSINRRELCKALAVTPFLKSLNAPATPPISIGQYESSNEITVNILLHGMFAILLHKDSIKGVDLLPPHVSGDTPHIYLATDLNEDPPVFHWLKRGTSYAIKPNGGAKLKPAPDVAMNAVVNLSATIKRNLQVDPHCTINLPWPDRFVALRSQKPLDPSKKIFKKAVGLVFEPPQLPLVTMLQYVVGTIDTGQPLSCNYHLFAEPQECPSDAHPAQAFDTLKKLYLGLDDLVINDDLKVKDFQGVDDPAGTGITSDDESAIVELDGLDCRSMAKPPKSASPPLLRKRDADPPGSAQIPHLAIHPTACMSLITVET
jgi:hypothetical protein